MENSQFKLAGTEKIITVPSIYLPKTKVSSANSSVDFNQIISSFLTQLSDATLHTFVKTTYHP